MFDILGSLQVKKKKLLDISKILGWTPLPRSDIFSLFSENNGLCLSIGNILMLSELPGQIEEKCNNCLLNLKLFDQTHLMHE